MRDLASNLHHRKQNNLYRKRRVHKGMHGIHVNLDGKDCLAFSSNDYLGLSHHPDLIHAMQKAANEYGVGSGSAHLVNGHSIEHHRLEEELAAFIGQPRALLFSTGYMANLGVMSALLERGDHVYEDRLNHASLIDAALMSGARLQRYQHNDVNSLQNKLDTTSEREKLIATDGVFSMDGDIAPLPELASIAQENHAWLLVDDAHGLGVMGKHGRGTPEYFELEPEMVSVYMGTLGKALGTFGAFVAGSEELIETLINHARTYIYTTAPPPAVAAATRASLRLVQQEPWRRDKLHDLIAQFKKGAQELGLDLMSSQTPIQPIMIGDTEKAVQTSKALWEEGIYIPAIRPPTVPEGEARLRVSLSADHEPHNVSQLLDALEKVMA